MRHENHQTYLVYLIMRNSFLVILSIILFLLSCNRDKNKEEIVTSIKGKAQKGPFVNGSTVVIYELDKNLNPTGRSFSSKITNNQGSYQIDSITLSSPYIQVEVEGLYYSELDGNVSFREITINSLAKVSEGKTSNVNLITQIENTRVKNLVDEGLSFEEAKIQSLEELVKVFSYPYEVDGTSESFDLFADSQDGIFLFCLSAVLLATNDDYDAAKYASWLNFLLELEADFGDNGKIDSSDLENRLKLGVFYTLRNADSIRDGFKKTIEVTGASIEVPYFEPIVEKLFTDYISDGEADFEDVEDFFPFSEQTNIANLLDGSLISTQDLILALDAPSDMNGNEFTLDIKAFSSITASLESPAWEHYDAEGVYATINLPSNNLLGRIEIPFTYNGVGTFSLTYFFKKTEEGSELYTEENYRKVFYFNSDTSLPSEIDTVIISSASNVMLSTYEYDNPTYVIVENVESLDILRVNHVTNLYGIEFPDLKTINQEFNVTTNLNLRSFKAPRLGMVDANIVFAGNPLITTLKLSEINSVSGDVQIYRNNNMKTLNFGGLSFGDDFSNLIDGGRLIQWVFNGQIIEDRSGI